MGIYILKRKSFSKYDDTDNLKRMKDSDILAEKPLEPETTRQQVLTGAAGTALVGAGAGLGIHTIRKIGSGSGGVFSKSRYANLTGKGLRKAGKTGLIIGAGYGILHGISKRNKERAKNSWYNDRLEYAQRQARRREKADWKANMTQRDGYSY